MKKVSPKNTQKQSKQSFSDFAGKLSAKWRLLTQPAKPVQPGKAKADEMETILRQLVGTPTVTGNYDANHDALDYIERFLQKRGMLTQRLEWNNLETLVATTRKTKTPKVALAAHLDVVPGDQSLFELREADGKYFGRGTLDMKFAIAAFMQCIDDLSNDLKKYDIGIFITTDEEAGGVDGDGNLAKEGYLPKVCIIPDGGDDWQIQVYSKGFLSFSISAEGKSAHGSRPWEGDNAIQRVINALDDCKALFPKMSAKTNTMNIGRIHGGQAVNQVAQHAEALVDVRFIAQQDADHLLKAMEDICHQHGAKLQLNYEGAPTNFDLKDPLIAPMVELITEVTGVPVTGSRTLGSNNARFYAERGVPCISVYPKGGNHHSPNEWLDKEAFFQFHTILLRYLQQIARR